MNAAALLKEKLQVLQPQECRITDESALHKGHKEAGNGAHLRLRIVSAQFANLPPLARHKLVYKAAGNLSAAGIHALAISASPPENTTKETL